jgi:hypothetical protein
VEVKVAFERWCPVLRVMLTVTLMAGPMFGQETKPRTLDTMTVTAPKPLPMGHLADFERRRAHYIGGIFITRADIVKHHVMRGTNLFFGLPGVRIIDSSGTRLLASARGDRPNFRRGDMVPCYFNVGVDGVVMPFGRSVDDIPIQEIEAIEVYQGAASMPRDLMVTRPNGYCGLVMIWTRSQ